jgi:hypothetical protein
MALEAPVLLALTAKFSEIFDDPDVFLAFPLTVPSFRAQDLEAIVDGAQTAEELQTLTEWVRMINRIPDTGPILNLDGRLLWDSYFDVSVRSEVRFARSRTAAEDDAELAAANAIIADVDSASGRRVPSARLLAYNQFKDLWFIANQEYRQRAAEISASADPAERRLWAEAEQSIRLENIRQVEGRWRIEGFRDEVDAAYRTIAEVGARDPEGQWRDWAGRFSPELDQNGDLNLLKSVPTGFSPADFMRSDAWSSLRMTRADVERLAENAAEPLRRRLASGQLTHDFAAVTLEYTSVSVQRAWFQKDLFAARFWRFADPQRILSDGSRPPIGELPAYIAAVVFVRNVAIERLIQGEPSTMRVQPVASVAVPELAQSPNASSFRFEAAAGSRSRYFIGLALVVIGMWAASAFVGSLDRLPSCWLPTHVVTALGYLAVAAMMFWRLGAVTPWGRVPRLLVAFGVGPIAFVLMSSPCGPTLSWFWATLSWFWVVAGAAILFGLLPSRQETPGRAAFAAGPATSELALAGTREGGEQLSNLTSNAQATQDIGRQRVAWTKSTKPMQFTRREVDARRLINVTSALDRSRSIAPAPAASQPPPTAVLEKLFADGGIGLCAFIARAVGRCPDPDPTLDWNDDRTPCAATSIAKQD